jgi:DNA-binding MarR family transcriptional regulator
MRAILTHLGPTAAALPRNLAARARGEHLGRAPRRQFSFGEGPRSCKRWIGECCAIVTNVEPSRSSPGTAKRPSEPQWYSQQVRAQTHSAQVVAPVQPRVTYLVKRLELAVRSEIDAIVCEYGVTALQYTALSVLARHPGLSGAQLARRSFVSMQAGSEMVGVLERKGLISRSPHETNRRVLRISLTASGEELLSACQPAVDDLERRIVKRLSDERARNLRDDLASCIDELSHNGP